MEQVKELFRLIELAEVDVPLIATNFLFRRVQPCNDRVHPLLEYEREEDATQETSANFLGPELNSWLNDFFIMTGYTRPPRAQ